jgi:hypothetical protein
MLSKGVGVYHMANQNTSIGKYPEEGVPAQRRTAELGGSSWQFFLSNLYLPNIAGAEFPEDSSRKCNAANWVRRITALAAPV